MRNRKILLQAVGLLLPIALISSGCNVGLVNLSATQTAVAGTALAQKVTQTALEQAQTVLAATQTAISFTATPTATPTQTEPTATPTEEDKDPDPPTLIPTAMPTPTPTPTATPIPTPKPDAVVNMEALLNLRSGPGTYYDTLGVLEEGDPLRVTDRNHTGDWLRVIAPDGQEGWVAYSVLQVNVDMAGVPVAQAPPTPTPMYTPTPTITPTPALLPPPILLEPQNGASFIGEPVLLKWQWDRPRAPDEVFSVRVRREGETKLCHHAQAKDLEYKGSLTYCTAGNHYWGVALVRDLAPWLPEDDENRWQDLSEPSDERWFYYVPPEEPWTLPIPTPSGGGGDDGPCPGCRP
jgi:type II secretory pathway pseudopilin PulG